MALADSTFEYGSCAQVVSLEMQKVIKLETLAKPPFVPQIVTCLMKLSTNETIEPFVSGGGYSSRALISAPPP